MVKNTLTELANDYREYTDKYFLRARQILFAENINPIVRYQVFARKNIEELAGVNEAVEFIKEVAGKKATVYCLKDYDRYKAKKPIMKIEGRVQDLVELETVYLEILSGNLTPPIDLKEVRKKARAIKQAAPGKSVIYFGARHFAPHLDAKIAKICQQEGFEGCSTDIGARAWNTKGGGTVPHASVLAYKAYMEQNNIKGNPTVEAAKAFDRYADPRVPRINLIDTFNKEIDDAIATAKAVPNLAGVRIDTCGENYAQGAREVKLPKLDGNVDPKYLRGKGVTIAAVWALRQGLDKAGFKDLEIVVSSGFNAEKTTAFMVADKTYQRLYNKPLFNIIGTGSIAKPVMTTADIVAYYDENKQEWLPNSKTGRQETPDGLLGELI